MKHAAATLILRNARALILKRGPTAPWHPNLWNFPGGRLDPGETYLEAAVRECFEETQLQARNLQLCHRYTHEDRWTLRVFACEAEGQPQLNYEHTEFQWVSIDDVDDFEYVPGVRAALIAVL